MFGGENLFTPCSEQDVLRRNYVRAVGRRVEDEYGVNGAEEFALRMNSGDVTAAEILHFSRRLSEVSFEDFEVVISGDVIACGEYSPYQTKLLHGEVERVANQVPFDDGDGVLYNFNLETYTFE